MLFFFSLSLSHVVVVVQRIHEDTTCGVEFFKVNVKQLRRDSKSIAAANGKSSKALRRQKSQIRRTASLPTPAKRLRSDDENGSTQENSDEETTSLPFTFGQ